MRAEGQREREREIFAIRLRMLVFLLSRILAPTTCKSKQSEQAPLVNSAISFMDFHFLFMASERAGAGTAVSSSPFILGDAY